MADVGHQRVRNHRQRIRTPGENVHQVSELFGRDPARLGDLPVVEHDVTVVAGDEAVRDHPDGLVLESLLADEVQWRVDDSEFLGQLATGTLQIRLTRGEDTTGGHVPVAGPHIFVVGSTVDEQPIFRVEHRNSDPTVAKVVASHPRSGGDALDAIEVVHHIDEIFGCHVATVPGDSTLFE